MLRKTMVVLAVLLAVGLGQMLPVGPIAVPGQGILVKPGPIAGHRSGGAGGGTDAGYILQEIVNGGNGYMYGPVGYGSYSMGFSFTPILSGRITKIGRYRGGYSEASTVKLWDSDGTQLASASVTGTNWSYVDITPVGVSSGHDYFVTTYGGSYVYYYAINYVPFDMNDVTLNHGAYQVGDGMPIYDAGTYVYGCADFYFEPVPSTETWTGAVSDDWGTGGNWDGNYAPGLGIIAIVPGSCPRYPTTNSLATYGCKTLSIGTGASMTVVSGKALTCQIDLDNDGTLTGDASISCNKLDNDGTMTVATGTVLTCAGDLTNIGTLTGDGDVNCKALYNASAMTVGTGATLTCKGDITNAGTLTNNGYIICPKGFANTGTFSSGTYSEFHFSGSADATFAAGSLDAGSGFYHLFIEKVAVAAVIGGDPNGGQNWYFGPSGMTLMAAGGSPAEGDVYKWSLYNMWGTYDIKAKIMRAGYNGYDWGTVVDGQVHTSEYGFNEYYEDLPGVEIGDRIAAYDGGIIPFLGEGGMLIYYGDVTVGANGWYDWGYGPLALRGEIAIPAGDVTSTGDVTIGGDLMIETDNDLIVNGSGHYTVTGMWTDNGSFNPGAGTVTFDGESQIAGTAAHTFNNLDITGTLFAPAAMTVNGTWACSGIFDHGSGTVTFKGSSITSGGQPFNKLIVNNTSDGDVTLVDDVTVDNALTLTSGNFLVGAHTLTLGTAGAAATAVVNGGLFSVVGTSSSVRGTVTAAAESRPYSFTVNPGAGIAAKYANFTWMGANGVDIKNGATIDATNNFTWTAFTAGGTAGTMLKVENGQTVDDIMFADFNGTTGYNIDYTAGSGHMTVSGGMGALWGEDFDNDPANKVDWVVLTIHDVGVTAIQSPAGTVGEHMILFPKGTVKNYGEAAEDFDIRVIISDGTDAEVFNQVEHVTGLAIGETRNFAFTVNSWDPTPQGPFHVLAKTELAGDAHPENDVVEQDFTVGPPYTAGWHLVSQMPSGAKPIKDGAWLAYDAGSADGTGLIFASRGNKTPDFFSYDPMGNVWTPLAPWLLGAEAKLPSKGSAGCADGNGVIYATKGNNKPGFWKYTAATNAWTQLLDVPLGVSNKGVKGGTGIAFAYKAGVGSPYLLKGYKNEFYRYDIATNAWQTLPVAPMGGSQKWDKGSWLVSDGQHTLYALKAKLNEFYSYDTELDVWSGPLVGMPMSGTGGAKKAKDGSCGAYTPAGSVFAFKGGNTQEFWNCTFTTDGNAWAEKETIPRAPIKKKVKAGGSMVAVGGLVFGTKGNKTNELWMYVPSSFASEPPAPQRDGVLAGKTVIAQGMSISPNPLASGFAVLRYGLPKAGAAQLSVYNMAGQTVMTRKLATGRSGNVNLDLRHLSDGVYLVKLSSDGFENSQKLVVQR